MKGIRRWRDDGRARQPRRGGSNFRADVGPFSRRCPYTAAVRRHPRPKTGNPRQKMIFRCHFKDERIIRIHLWWDLSHPVRGGSLSQSPFGKTIPIRRPGDYNTCYKLGSRFSMSPIDDVINGRFCPCQFDRDEAISRGVSVKAIPRQRRRIGQSIRRKKAARQGNGEEMIL